MPVFYRHPTRPYRDIPIAQMRRAVESFENAMMAYRKEEIGLSDLQRVIRHHEKNFSDVSVAEVFSTSSEIRQDAEDLVNRNELAFRYANVLVRESRRCCYIKTVFSSHEGDDYLKRSREERIQDFVNGTHRKAPKPLGWDLPTLEID